MVGKQRKSTVSILEECFLLMFHFLLTPPLAKLKADLPYLQLVLSIDLIKLLIFSSFEDENKLFLFSKLDNRDNITPTFDICNLF